MTYLDTSAMVKRYVLEKGTPYVRHLLSRHPLVATSKVAYVEMHSTFARLRREGRFTASQHAAACRSFEKEFERCYVVNLGNEVSAICGRLAPRHSLKGLDLVHLASALFLHERFKDQLSLGGADRQLLRAAESEGIITIDVERVDASRGALG